MNLTDLLPVGKWVEIEKDIAQISGLNVSVFNTAGIRITDFQKWVNKLCPAIKANKKGQDFICSVAHQNIAGQAKETKDFVIESCDAGLLKVVVPIFVKDEFIGVIGCCGLILDENEIETFLINKTTDISEEEIETLSRDIGILKSEEVIVIAQYIKDKIHYIINNYCNYQ